MHISKHNFTLFATLCDEQRTAQSPFMAIRVVEFSNGGFNIRKIFGQKSTVVNWNNWNLQIGVMGRCQKVPKSDFQSQFSTSKIIWIFLIFFFALKNTNLGAHFLLLAFFDNINFQITLFSKMMPNFWQFATTPILKIQ